MIICDVKLQRARRAVPRTDDYIIKTLFFPPNALATTACFSFS